MARFICAIGDKLTFAEIAPAEKCWAYLQGRAKVYEGKVEGEIIWPPRGEPVKDTN